MRIRRVADCLAKLRLNKEAFLASRRQGLKGFGPFGIGVRHIVKLLRHFDLAVAPPRRGEPEADVHLDHRAIHLG